MKMDFRLFLRKIHKKYVSEFTQKLTKEYMEKNEEASWYLMAILVDILLRLKRLEEREK